MEKEELIKELESLKFHISNTLSHCEPENLPHKPIRMTVLDKDVVLIERAIEYLKKES